MAAAKVSPDTTTFNGLLAAFARAGRLNVVRQLLDTMRDTGLAPDDRTRAILGNLPLSVLPDARPHA